MFRTYRFRLFIKALLLVHLLALSISAFSQHKKTNWLEDKKEFTGRWRIGVGLDVCEPTGIDIQFYRLSKICTNDFSILKKIAVGVWVGKEGVISRSLLKNINSWESGGIRYGLDLKFYIPIFLNPYLGFGGEVGARNINGTLDFYPDAIARIGLEQKVLGVKLSNKSSLNATIFIDGKYNKCLTSDFSYILPSIGVRIHFL